MELLDSIIAFALIMAALASVVTLIMELFHRLTRLRAKGMEHLFEQFYRDVIVQKLGISAKDEQKVFNAVLYSPVRDKLIAKSRFLPKRVVGFLTAHTEVNTDDLLKRLDQAGAFDDLRKRTRPKFRKALETIEAQYDDYSAAATDYFKRRAQLFSLIVGVILAFSVNIDGMRILDALMVSPQVRSSIISQQLNLEKSFQAIQAEATKAQKANGTTDKADKQQIEQLKKGVAEVSQNLKNIGSMGVSIGWQYPAGPFKAHDSSGLWKTLCNLFSSIGKDPGGFLVWAFKVFITGLLIGLGAPFWFDVARKLSQVRQAFGGKGATSQQASAPVPNTKSQAQTAMTTIDKIVHS